LAEDRLENLKNLENQPIGIKNLISHEERFKTDDEDSVHVRTNVTTFLAPIRPYRFEAKGLIPHNRCRPLVLTRRDPGLIEEESVHSSVIARNRVFRLKSSLQSPPKAERLRRIRLLSLHDCVTLRRIVPGSKAAAMENYCHPGCGDFHGCVEADGGLRAAGADLLRLEATVEQFATEQEQYVIHLRPKQLIVADDRTRGAYNLSRGRNSWSKIDARGKLRGSSERFVVGVLLLRCLASTMSYEFDLFSTYFPGLKQRFRTVCS
jgi:hypothetical protein